MAVTLEMLEPGAVWHWTWPIYQVGRLLHRNSGVAKVEIFTDGVREVKDVAPGTEVKLGVGPGKLPSHTTTVVPTEGALPSTNVIAKTEDTTITQGRKGGKRYSLFDHPVTAVLRWMGEDGWTVPEARKALNKLGFTEVSDSTIQVQVNKGKKLIEAGANLDKSQIDQLRKAKLDETAVPTVHPTGNRKDGKQPADHGGRGKKATRKAH